MYWDHQVTAKIARVLEMADMSALLIDANGDVILPEEDRRHFTLPEALKLDPTTPLVYGGVTLIGTEADSPAFICLHGDSAEAQACARLCAELVNMVLHSEAGQTNREQALRMILRGDVDPCEMECVAAEQGFPLEADRCVMCFQFSGIELETVLPVIEGATEGDRDMIAEVGHSTVALVRTLIEDEDVAELHQYAEALQNSIEMESGSQVYVGISDVHRALSELPDAYGEARAAIGVGRVYHVTRRVFAFRQLLLERFLNDVPADMSARYNSTIFNRKTARLFNEEMLHTIETFFENSLNLSETARKLYIHRNTLVYRLEKIERIIGLDLRNFDDAVTFKMILLLGKNAARRHTGA